MANAWCINAIWFDWCFIQTLQNLDSACIWVWVQFTAPNPLDDKRFDYIKYTDKCWNTCCLTWENEILIYATNWVIKNLTLTNDDANEVVNVKRNDIFWSNWKKTVVRYKTWWYPTSITDWTLAVEELVQNQYSSSWYNVSWLSDATTYYFSVFAVAQDDTIIVVQTWTVETDFFLNKYQRVEYIQRNWNNYIDTWRIPKWWLWFEVRFWYKIPTSWRRYFCVWNWTSSTNSYPFCCEINSWSISTNKARAYSENWNNTWVDFFSSNSLTVWQFADIIVKSTWSIQLNWTTTNWTLYSWSWYYNNSAYIFIDRALRRSEFSANPSLSYMQIYEWWNLVRDFFLAYRKSDNVIWLLDKANRVFYTNKASWTFVKWWNISR